MQRFVVKKQTIIQQSAILRSSRFLLNFRKAYLSSTTSSSSSPSSNSEDSTSSFASLKEEYRRDILNSSLHQVHKHGWTEDAIAQGIVSNPIKKYPPSFIGMMNDNHSKSSDLIHFFMKESNMKLKLHLEELRLKEKGEKAKTNAGGNEDEESIFGPNSHSKLLKYAIQYRLEMVIPFVQSNRWAEGMALGARPYNAMSTASHLEEIVNILQESLGPTDLTPIQRSAIGAVYVTTELHLLADTSFQYEDTWKFLSNRIDQLDAMQQSESFLPLSNPQQLLNQDTVVAGFAVASSLGSAVLSLMTPVARSGVSAVAGTVVPQVMNVMSNVSNVSSSFSTSPPGTTAKDYDMSDLPPFEEVVDSSNGKK